MTADEDHRMLVLQVVKYCPVVGIGLESSHRLNSEDSCLFVAAMALIFWPADAGSSGTRTYWLSSASGSSSDI